MIPVCKCQDLFFVPVIGRIRIFNDQRAAKAVPVLALGM
jgi:hypothetical protein